MKFRPFSEARGYVRSLKLKNRAKWLEYSNSGEKPEDVPTHPEMVYNGNWVSWGNWLGDERLTTRHIEFLPFEEARMFARSLKFKNREQWNEWRKSGKRPKNIPTNPNRVYKKDWISWGNWLGNEYRSFQEATKYARSLGLESIEEWKRWCKSGNKPEDIPVAPNEVYSHEWTSWGNWLGTGFVAQADRAYRSFQEATKYARSLGIKNSREWKRWCKSGNKPEDIPARPDHVYKEWISYADFLGSGTESNKNIGKGFWPFEEATKYARSLGLESIEEWKRWCKSGKKPDYIPSNPHKAYEKEWISYGDWLGTGIVATYNREYLPFEEARKYIHSLELKSYDEWSEYCKSGKKPNNIPAHPYTIYKNEWKGLPDWLGYEETDWSVRRVKELLHDLIKSKIIYQWDEAVLYSFLLRRGLLNIQGRHKQFFKNLIEASRTDEGRKSIEEYANSNAEVPPDLSKLTPFSNNRS